MPRRVLVTGANGHIGCHVVRAVLDEGWAPIAFVRPGSERRGLTGVEVELREGDLLDVASVDRAMEGVDVVLHVGAVHRNLAKEDDEIVRPAVEGTRNVVAAARRAGVGRLVHTSTGATVGFARDPKKPLDETHTMVRARSAYIRGKIEAEHVALAANDADLEVVVLNPSGVFGPRDYRLTPATRGLVGLLQGDPAFLSLCVTDVRDVATAHVRAVTRGRPGERYLVTGENIAPRALAALFDELAGMAPPTFRPPTFLLRFLIRRMETKALREGTDPPASRDAFDDLDGGHLAYDSTKSSEGLGMAYRSPRDVLRDAFRWLLHVHALATRREQRVREALGVVAAPDPDWV